MNKWTGLYLLVINAAAFIAFGVDKRRAVQGGWRIRVRTLLGLAVFGGSAGALLGMLVFHHKTRKAAFYIGIPILLIAQTAAVILLGGGIS